MLADNQPLTIEYQASPMKSITGHGSVAFLMRQNEMFVHPSKFSGLYYNFTKASRADTVLINDSIWTDDILAARQNDIYEGQFEWQFRMSIDDGHQTLLDKVRQHCDAEFRNSKPLSAAYFSEDPYIPLMWAHYADSHRGVCFGYERFALANLVNKHQGHFGPVRYSNRPPTIRCCSEHLDVEELYLQWRQCFLCKSAAWSYEREWRLLLDVASGPHRFDAERLKCVIIGARIAPTDQITIVNKVESFMRKHNHHVQVYYASPSIESYKIAIYNQPQAPPTAWNREVFDTGRINPIHIANDNIGLENKLKSLNFNVK